MHGYKVLQLNKTNQLSIKFHLLANFSKKFNLLLYLKNLNLCSILFFQNSNFNSSFSRKLVPQFDSQFKSKNLNPKTIVFRFIIKYSSLRDFGAQVIRGLFSYEKNTKFSWFAKKRKHKTFCMMRQLSIHKQTIEYEDF